MPKFIGKVTRGSSKSCGLDLYAVEDVTIQPQLTALVDVGLTWSPEDNDPLYCGIIKDRSSMAAKGLRVGGGVIDMDYAGPIKVVMCNHNFHPMKIAAGERVAQLIVMPFIMVDIPSDAERGSGGFGSTGS